MGMQDVYKLAYQAALGCSHAFPDRKSAERSLKNEICNMGKGTSEPLCDIISPDNEIARIHLRPYIEENPDIAGLLDAFVRTAEKFKGNTDRLLSYWNEICAMAESSMIPFSIKELEGYFSEMKQLNFPATSHSDSYRGLYRPAYRVVCTRFLALQDIQRRL